MARREEVDGHSDRSKKRRIEEDERHKHKHRKHKHRSHRKHKDSSEIEAVEQRNPPEETEDGEILDTPSVSSLKEDGIISSDTEEQVDNWRKSPTPDRKRISKSRDDSPHVSIDRKRSRSQDRSHRSPDRKRSKDDRSNRDVRDRERSRDDRDRSSRRDDRERSRDDRDRTSRDDRDRTSRDDRDRTSRDDRDRTSRDDRDRTSRDDRDRTSRDDRDRSNRDDQDRSRDERDRDRMGRRYTYSPDRERRSKSRDYDERDKYDRRRGESRDRNYKEDRASRQERDKNDAMNKQESEKQENKPTEEPNKEEENTEQYLERVAHQLAEQEEDIEKVKEESRRRRQAILEKYKQQQQQEQHNTNSSNDSDNTARVSAPVPVKESDSGEEIIDPSTPVTLGKTVPENGAAVKKSTGGLGEGTPPKSEKPAPADMFCDIFGESPPEIRKVGGKGETLAVNTSGLTDNWDDPDGYYTYRVGEVLDNRYEIAASHGRGVFSTVVRARDTKAGKGEPEEVAIKIIRSNETMYKAGQMELVILRKLAGADLENKRHCVRLLSSFEYRNHLCLVFESLHMNLREILKKFGRNIGISLAAIKSYATQLFIALKHLRNCGVLHCDIKPDNMLVNENKNILKLCDFGSAMFAGENEITPYLVSRFYRAPEIILGLPYDHALDMWSVGCCLYELYSGKVLFPGATNNDMLRLHMELKGPFPKKMLRKAAFANQHFDPDFNFHAVEEDPVTKKPIKRMLSNVKPRDISTLISKTDEDPKMLGNFRSLLERIFILDPEKRLTVSQALQHPFIKEATPKY